MAKDNAIEFTENKYATRKEMGNDLYIQVPEAMWQKIIEYRKTFYNPLNIQNYNGQGLFLCLYPTLAGKVSQIESKLARILKEYNALSETNRDKEHFHISLLANCLYNIAVNREVDIEDSRLRKLIISENPYDEVEDSLLNYYNALKFIEDRYVNNIDIDFLADLYSKVSGISELTYFYRDSNIADDDSKAMVGRVFTSAPHQRIEAMMDLLFSFISNSTLTVYSKAIITYFYILFIKPFNDFNEEIAALLAKAVLAHFSLGEIASILPFENILKDKKENLRRLFLEIVNTNDVTYYVSPATFSFDKNIDKYLEVLKDYSIEDLKHDFYKEDEKVKPEPKPEIKEEVKPEPKNEIKEEPKPEPKPEVKEEVKPEPKPEVKEEVKPEPKPEKKEPFSSKEEYNDDSETEKNSELAYSFVPDKVDEARAKRLEEHLLELDTRLSKKQAYFYARHCALGKYYSIEQYKKCCKCVYETARKGMEELTNYGYYKKIKVRKKFLYTPIRK